MLLAEGGVFKYQHACTRALDMVENVEAVPTIRAPVRRNGQKLQRPWALAVGVLRQDLGRMWSVLRPFADFLFNSDQERASKWRAHGRPPPSFFPQRMAASLASTDWCAK